MAETAARWCEDLLPAVPYRQYVLTVRWGRRKQLAYRPEVARAVLQAALDEVFGWARGTARERLGLEDARTGAVTVTQSFGKTMRLRGVVTSPVSASYIVSTLGRSARAGPTGPLFP